MKPLPFPYPLNIGTDIVHLPRILRLITRPAKTTSSTSSSAQQQNLHRFVRRILCEQEQEDFRRRFGLQKHGEQSPIAVTTDMARWLAGRFAAKEAARKAAPGGAASIGWKDVCVRTDGEEGRVSSRPEVVYRGLDNRIGKLSISHDGEYVVATVLAAG
ncbi:hypothetical protein VTN49DRAFT_187 [Thermomyces lanuginosus]|uniref:uncharacterized protein n=1 Tax=Thermomyces lanuginosus TaxID=5541 RepID=UPI0037420CEE